MYCPGCKVPRVFRHDFKTDTYYCPDCGQTYSGEEMREYGLMLQRQEQRSREIEDYEWRDFEDGWRPD